MATQPIEPQPSFLALEPNRPYRLRASGARLEDREITDPVTRQPKRVSVLVLDITHVNGETQPTTLSFTAFKAQQALVPFVNSGELFRRTFQLTRRGVGYATEYELVLL